MRRWGIWLLSILAISAAISSGWFDTSEPGPAFHANTGREPDYRMTRFELTAMNSSGTPLYQLTADHMRHYADDDSAEFDAPRVHYSPKHAPDDPHQPMTGQREWEFTAERGWSAKNGTEVQLRGRVNIEASAAETQPSVRIETSDLTLFPGQQRAQTQAAIRISQYNAHIEGVGLYADMQTGQIQLNSQVRGQYAP